MPNPNSASPAFIDIESDRSSGRHGSVSPNAQSLEFLERQYEAYVKDRSSVSPEWREYFDELQAGDDTKVGPSDLQEPFGPTSIFHPKGGEPSDSSNAVSAAAVRQERIDQLIRNYRVRGHIIAQVDPLGAVRPQPSELDPAFYGFSESDMETEVSTQWVGGEECRTLGDVLHQLKSTYCRSIGVQFMHIYSLQVRTWLCEQMERTGNRKRLEREEQLRILRRLSDAVMFEEFVQKKYVGAKSFSLEGAESLIPLLDLAIERAGKDGIDLIVMGMAHRGRLNVLANILGKRPSQIFREFEDRDPEKQMGRGDVKYHLGYSSDWQTAEGQKVHLTLCFNPSHLEYVNPVALGRLRGKQDDRGEDRSASMGILIHGDAAFIGEGVVQETLNFSELPGYSTGGTLHIIVNNQIGFTTSASEGRSSTYATDVARMLQVPIFHVNGEDPEAVAQTVHLAMSFRQRFKRDVIIDMYCFRRRGHNEGDEPAFTQPTMYEMIRHRETVFENYLSSMLSLNEVTREEAELIKEKRAEILETELAEARKDGFKVLTDSGGGVWDTYFGGPVSDADSVDTTVEQDKLQGLMKQALIPPNGFNAHPRLKRMLDSRQKMIDGEQPFDWGTAEVAAMATILADDRQLRFSGQDVRRGTFSHRHAYLFDTKTGSAWSGLEDVAPDSKLVEFYNSPLSENGVLGFEYGYSLDRPEGLTIWEAQFGDFANAAQVIIDQFITSGEDKWNRLSGLVMLLPHGFEGQGPEHSSARLERFLSLAAEDNIQITVPTTPAQHFHMLRRQVLRSWKKPLIVMTPKSLLRNKDATSTLAELSSGQFHEVIGDETVDKPSRILLCSGKVYYELDSHRQEQERSDVAIIRLEQLYPLPKADLQKELDKFPADVPVYWVQEEPQNMGAWSFLRVRFGDSLFGHPFAGITRPESASPATGSGTSHKIEQQILIDQAFETHV